MYDLAWPRLGVESAELPEIAVDHEVFQFKSWRCSRNPLQRKNWHESE